MRSATVIFAAVALCAIGCKKKDGDRPRDAATEDATPVEKKPPAPRLVVLVVVDQLPRWSFEDDLAHLSGGFHRLATHGRLYSGEFPYANTFTAPGHAALATGASPAQTGVLANTWYEGGVRVKSVTDPRYDMLKVTEPPPNSNGRPNPGVSAHRLELEGIGDILRAGKKGKGVSIGLKARAAALAIGKEPDLVLWYDAHQAAMSTSNNYAAVLDATIGDGATKKWLEGLAAKQRIAEQFSYVWEPKDPARLEKLAEAADDAPGEGDNYGLDATFPHPVDAGSPAQALRATPIGTDIVFDTALATIKWLELGADEQPDLLSLTISSHDYAGHYWGQESWERTELLLHLDEALARFMADLDQRVGEGRYTIVLTSDHGATPVVERSAAAGKKAYRLKHDTLRKAAEEAIASVLGQGRWVSGVAANMIYMKPQFREQPEAKRSAALDAAVAAVKKIDGVGYVARTDAIAGNCDQRNGLEAFACRVVHPTRSGEIFCAAAPLSLSTEGYFSGTSHGSPSEDDRIVPILLYGPGVTPGPAWTPASILAVTPTLAAMLQIEPPTSAKEASLWPSAR